MQTCNLLRDKTTYFVKIARFYIGHINRFRISIYLPIDFSVLIDQAIG